LRQQLERLLEENGLNENDYKQMKSEFDKLENMLLNEGLSKESIDQMEVLKHELLKLENAEIDQGTEEQRQSKENTTTYFNESKESLNSEYRSKIREEFLIRRSLPLQQFYQERVNYYFNNEKR
ncbi:MAG: hypothetical protein WBN28_02090, partial [Lutimonas sp.]